MGFKFSDDVPIYLQIINLLKMDIISGKYTDKLPAVRDLAMELGVNPNTVQRAFGELERQGLVQSERTSGRFISIDKKKIKELRKDLSNEYITKMYESLRKLGMNDKMIKDAVVNWKENS